MGCEIWKSPYRSFHQTAIPLEQKMWKYHHSGESKWQWMKLPRHQTLVSRMIKRKENLELYHLVNPTFSSFNLTFFHFLHLQPSNLLQENTILLLTEDTVSIIIKHPFDYNIYIYIYLNTSQNRWADKILSLWNNLPIQLCRNPSKKDKERHRCQLLSHASHIPQFISFLSFIFSWLRRNQKVKIQKTIKASQYKSVTKLFCNEKGKERKLNCIQNSATYHLFCILSYILQPFVNLYKKPTHIISLAF